MWPGCLPALPELGQGADARIGLAAHGQAAVLGVKLLGVLMSDYKGRIRGKRYA